MINQENLSPLEIDDQPGINRDAPSITSYMAAAATITTFAAGILGSAYLAYKNPGKWWLSALSVGLINLYTLPKFLRYGSPTVIKMALVANLIALSCLSLGGMSAACYTLSRRMISSFKAYHFSSALFSAFLLTGLMGYGFPFFQDALKKAYRFLHDAKVQERIAILYDQFHNCPEIGPGFLQANLWQSFILHLSLFKPRFILDFCQVFAINLPEYAWPMAIVASETTSLGHFKQMLFSMEELAENLALQGKLLSEEMKSNYSLGLKFALQSLKDSNLSSALQAMMISASKIVPAVISDEKFLELFQEECILDIANELIETFLSLTDSWKDLLNQYQKISTTVSQLKSEIQSLNLKELSVEEEEKLNERYENLNKDYIELRTEVEKVYSSKRIWQSVGSLWENETELPFERSLDLLPILQDQDFFKEVDTTYRELIAGGTMQGGNRSLIQELQLIKNRLVTIHEGEEDEEISAIMYLAINQGFVKGDYENLQLWLGLNSPHDLEEAMEKIGLATEANLYENDILPASSKSDILDNLHNFIKKAPKSVLDNQVKSEEEIDEASDIGITMDKVTRAIYYAISSGLILVPVLIHPEAGGTGFAIGLCFFTLKNFGIPGTQTIAEIGDEFIEGLPLSSTIRFLLNRRVFSLSQRRDAADYFAHIDFFTRMRIINLQIFISLFMSSFTIRHDLPFLGSFIQGMALSREVVELLI